MATHHWWEHANFYQIYPRSFYDGNNDALGDLRGIINKLPYVAWLGADAIWLSPFYPSPQHDSGYDVADPRGVDPMYGTLEEAEELIQEAHKRGLRVLVDQVPNHVSIEHAWFKEALSAPPGSPERARFHFLDGKGENGELPPNNWVSIFGGPAWTRITEPDGTLGQWYLHLFDSSQPDVNWANPEILENTLETLRFWLDRGVDGFRVDVALGCAKDMTYPDIEDPLEIVEAIRFDIEDGSPERARQRARVANSAFFDRDELADIYGAWRQVLDSYGTDRMAVVEAWVPPERVANYVSEKTLHQLFGFDFLIAPWVAGEMKRIITTQMASVVGAGTAPTWALGNHDSPRVVSRLGGGEIGRLRARAMFTVVAALPGAWYLYNGDELGLPDAPLADSDRQDPVFFRTNGEQKGRDAARVPLPWSGLEPPYGFSKNISEPTWLPQPKDWATFTVETQAGDPHSTLSLTRQLMLLRGTVSGLADNSKFNWLDEYAGYTVEEGVLAFQRGNGLVVVANTGSQSIPLEGEIIISSNQLQEKILSPNHAVWLQT